MFGVEVGKCCEGLARCPAPSWGLGGLSPRAGAVRILAGPQGPPARPTLLSQGRRRLENRTAGALRATSRPWEAEAWRRRRPKPGQTALAGRDDLCPLEFGRGVARRQFAQTAVEGRARDAVGPLEFDGSVARRQIAQAAVERLTRDAVSTLEFRGSVVRGQVAQPAVEGLTRDAVGTLELRPSVIRGEFSEAAVELLADNAAERNGREQHSDHQEYFTCDHCRLLFLSGVP